jgi:hypothetical protein
VNGHPTGTDLTSGTINANTFTDVFPGAWYEVAVTDYNLTADTKYAIVVRCLNGSDEDYVGWRDDYSSPTYTGGNAERSTNSGGAWTSYTGDDLMFEVWGHVLPVAYYQTVSEILGVVDSVGKVKGLHQTASEILGMLDSTPTRAAFKQPVSEKLGMVDSAPAKASFKQSVADSLGMVDSTPRTRRVFQTVQESLSMSDSVGTKAAFKRAVAEVLGLLDSATRGFPLKVVISEALGLRDRLEARRHAGKIGDLPDDTITGGAPPE